MSCNFCGTNHQGDCYKLQSARITRLQFEIKHLMYDANFSIDFYKQDSRSVGFGANFSKIPAAYLVIRHFGNTMRTYVSRISFQHPILTGL